MERRQCRNKTKNNIYKETLKYYYGKDIITKEARKYHNIVKYIKK